MAPNLNCSKYLNEHTTFFAIDRNTNALIVLFIVRDVLTRQTHACPVKCLVTHQGLFFNI